MGWRRSGFGRARRGFLALLRDRRGSVIVFVALAFSAMIGFAGLGVDVAQWYGERRTTQGMADAAAIGGTYADMAGQDLDGVTAAALAEAVRNGYAEGNGNELLVSLAPPPNAPAVTTPRVEVVVRRPIGLAFLRVFLEKDTQTIAARAVGGWRQLGPMCVIALDETAAGALTFGGNTTANIKCGVASNSSSSSAIDIYGNATLYANPAQAYGDIRIDGSGELISNFPPLPHSPRVQDPYGDRDFPPAPQSCDSSDVEISPQGTRNLDAGGGSYVICGKLDVKGTLNLAPGTYYVRDGDVTFNSQATITGTDVTLVVTGSAPSSAGAIRINGGATVNLTAPSEGDYAGIVIYKDRNASRQLARLNGGASMNLTGVSYMPGQDLEYSGGSDNDGCTQIIGMTVTFTGNSFIENTPQLCEDIGLGGSSESQQRQVVLVE